MTPCGSGQTLPTALLTSFLFLSLLTAPLRATDRPPVLLSSPTASLTLDLAACLHAAAANNPRLFFSQEDLKISRARERAASLALGPAITLKAEETRGKADQAGNTPSFVERLYGTQITQPLFHGGKRWAGQRQASLKTRIARLEVEKQRNDLAHQVTEAYWKVVALEAARKIYRETYEALQEDLEKAARHELSDMRSARIEILATRAQNRDCDMALTDLEIELAEARVRLLDLIGFRNVFPFDVPPDLQPRKAAVSEEECVMLARARRPEAAMADLAEDAAAWGRRAGAGVFYPQVDLNGFYGRSGSAYDETQTFAYRKDWNAGLKASWGFFGNTAAYSAYKERTSPKLGENSRTETETQSASLALGDALQSSIDYRESRKAHWQEQWKLDQTRRDIEQDARLAVQKAAAAWKRLEGAGVRLEKALQEMKDVRYLVQENRAHLGDLASARNRIAEAQASRARAAADYFIALSNVNRSVGVPDHIRLEGDK